MKLWWIKSWKEWKREADEWECKYGKIRDTCERLNLENDRLRQILQDVCPHKHVHVRESGDYMNWASIGESKTVKYKIVRCLTCGYEWKKDIKRIK